MNRISNVFLTICLLCLNVSITQTNAASSDANAFKLTQLELNDISFEASSIYEAVNFVMMKGIEQDDAVKKLWLNFGPMKPRGKEERVFKVQFKKVELWTLLRHCAEHFRMRITYKDNMIILDENWEEALKK